MNSASNTTLIDKPGLDAITRAPGVRLPRAFFQPN